MGDAIAHIMVSFGFAEHDFVTVSIETRKERGETYDTLKGFFRQYELIYIVGDERDLIRLRTNYRKDPPEDAYLYRTNAPPENVRRLFLSYFAKINELKEHPGFYNTLTTNCTTNVLMHTRVNPGNHALLVEDPDERLRAIIHLRARPLGHQPAVRGAEAALAHQRRGPGGGPGRRLLATDSCRTAEARGERFTQVSAVIEGRCGLLHSIWVALGKCQRIGRGRQPPKQFSQGHGRRTPLAGTMFTAFVRGSNTTLASAR